MKNIKKVIFWQNIISPHQIDFLESLSKNHEVILIVENIQDSYRVKDGWEIPENNLLNIMVAPKNLDQFFTDDNVLHIFSGISAYKIVFAGFKKAIVNKSKIGLISEPINLGSYIGFLKLIRGKYQCWKYANKIDFIATTGYAGVETFKKFGYNEKKIFQWGYFVKGDNCDESISLNKENTAVFVGNLNKNKQIMPLVKLFLDNDYDFDRLDIIGSGYLDLELRNLIKNNKKILLHDRLTNVATLKMMSRSRLLIIPSLLDGWAVVVNEALMAGTPVIASDAVGASILILDSNRGEVFPAGNIAQLNASIISLSKNTSSEFDFQSIRNWAREKISPDTAANYFSEIISFSFGLQSEKPLAPWLKIIIL
jgi:glycosyltransferase involved in cell wall biosynthesis